MGVCGSSENVEGDWGEGEEDQTMRAEAGNSGHVRENKVTGEFEDYEPGQGDRPDDDCFEFEAEEIKEGDQFMAVKPWIGAVKEPDNHPEVNKDAPDESYTLEYAYGYRCSDSRQNVYFNANGQVTYMTACLGVILDQPSNTQTFFGGNEVNTGSKQVSSTKMSHNNDIESMNVNTHGDRTIAATGQVGKNAAIFTWNTTTGEKINRVALGKGDRGCSAICVSPDGSMVATADKSNDNKITIWDMNSGDIIMQDKTGGDPINDLTFSKQDGKIKVWSSGPKGCFYFDAEAQKKKKCLFGSAPRTGFACITSDDQGNAYAGAANALIYKMAGNSTKDTYSFHERGFIGAIVWIQGTLYSGGRDGRVNVIDCGSMAVQKCIDFGCLIRAIDIREGELVVGLKTGAIVQCNLESQEMNTLMESHNDGEVWGLDIDNANVFTSGDDNQVKKWDPLSRKCIETAIVSNENRKAKKNRASTLGRHPPSQMSRGLAISSTGHLAICANDGHVYIRSTDDMNTNQFELTDSDEWMEVAQYSPDGSILAIGSHDTQIYLYNTEDYSLIAKCTSHKATLTCIDFSMDGSYIRSVCNAYELLFFSTSDGEQDKSGASNTTGTDWATGHCKFGWCVDGIFPKGMDGTHINGVDLNENQSLIAAGDDWGLVQLYRNPCRKGSKSRAFRAHSEHVVRVKFGRGDLCNYIFSVGGYDQTMLQWKLIE